MIKDKFKIQDEEYSFPYHHLVEFDTFSSVKILNWGFEYYAYNKFILDFLDSIEYNSLLDVGCGEGKLIKEIVKKPNSAGKKVIGIDMSERAILFAKAFNYGNGAIFEKKDIGEINQKYDVITLVQVLEHIPDQGVDGLVKNILNKLNDGGRLIVAVPAKNFSVLNKHYRHYDLEMLKEVFKDFYLEETSFMVKNALMYKIFLKLSGKFSSLGFFRNVVFCLAKNFSFKATSKNGRHIVCIFRKDIIK